MNKTRITKEFLEENGFKKRQENLPCSEYTNSDGDYRVMCRFGYTDGTMHEFGCIHIDCWLGDGTGRRIIKRASVHGCICTEEDLANMIRLCKIPMTVEFSPNNEQLQ